ncbi:hypothetical protein [Amycolatopsis anabasis]|uniref:hypothetical protein n=1 Tax=Amycolatopsis anabasis TaxID=1840409 RepID=UPI00131CC2BD|nr:hypothetical protein [Amycolatopsis anabasis]
MRQGRAVAIAAVALVGLTGCADRPNDLDTYYDDPTTSAPPERATPSAVAAPVPPPPPPMNQTAAAVAAATLTDADVAAEGVRPAGMPVRTTGCLAAVPPGETPPGYRNPSWVYPSGSSLTQQVTGYPRRSAADVLRELRCAGNPLVVPIPPGAEAVRAWCADGTCTVLLARGEVLSGLQVTASTAARAADAAKRLAPIVAAKLPTRPSPR